MSRRLSVWLAPSAFSPHVGGIETVTHELALTLSRAGLAVTIVTNRHPLDLPATESTEFGPLYRIQFTTPAANLASVAHHLAATRRIQLELGRLPPPDVIHLHGASSQMSALRRFATRRQIPLILTTHGEIVADAHRIFERSAYQRWALRRLVRRATVLTAPSRWAAEGAKSLDSAFGSARIVHNGIWPDEWAPGPAPCGPVAMAWGRHEWQKGFDLLLAAWRHVEAALPEARLILGGSGSMTPALREMATANTSLPGPLSRDQITQHLRSARVVVVPSRVEAFGVVALEALAANRVLIHSGAGGLAEATGGYGILADPNSPELLATAILNAFESEPANASDWVAEHAWPRVAIKYREAYADALERFGRAPEQG